jgi:hypothetical protein
VNELVYEWVVNGPASVIRAAIENEAQHMLIILKK